MCKTRSSMHSRPNGSSAAAIRLAVVIASALFSLAVAAQTGRIATNLTYTAALSLKETFDSNVYLQDVEPDRNRVPNAVEPFQQSFVTSLKPFLGIGYTPLKEFNLAVDYAPDFVFYHAEPGEDHVTHVGHVNADGEIKGVQWRTGNMLKWIQGSCEGLYFGGPGGVPALGGIPIRDRRAQFVYLGDVDITWEKNKWFVRPLAHAYWHDFHTIQLDPRQYPGYENYLDRREFNAGIDIGHDLNESSRLYVGYRYGQEIQGRTPISPFHYDSEYHRPVAGIEGQPLSWLKANGSVGPDIHHTIHDPSPLFEPNYTTVWANIVVTVMPTEKDDIIFTWKQNTQPAFAATSVYDDIIYDGAYKHRFSDNWGLGAGFRLYIGNWLAPANREDWIYTARAALTYTHNNHLRAELGYSYDWAESKVPNTEGREFTRHLASIGATYSF